MFASYEYISTLMHLLLVLAGIVIVATMMVSNFIVNFPRLFLRLTSFLFNVVGVSVVEIFLKILRVFALELLFNLILAQIGKFCLHNVKSMIFILTLSLIYSLINFQESSFVGIFVIITFLILFVDKIFAIKRTKVLLNEAKQFEKAAIRASQRRRLHDTLTNFGRALDIYKLPLLAKNPSLDAERAYLLERMAIVLEKDIQPDKALLRFHQALDIYRKPHLANNSALKKRQLKVLAKTAKILYELGRHREAKKRYELISELTGKRITYFG